MKAEIIAVGTEILIGDINNTHAQYLSKELASLGISVLWHTTVGDNPNRLKEAIDTGIKRSDIIIFTGGLGPTKDDLTKEMVAKELSKELVKDMRAKDNIENMLKNTKREITNNNYKQAMVIEGSKVFYNENGTAPGMAVNENGKTIILLPGPPLELIAMFEKYVKSYLMNLTNSIILSHNIHLYGIGESKVDEVLADILEGVNPTVGIYAKTGEVRVRITSKAKNKQLAEELMKKPMDIVSKRLSEFIYGIDVENMQTALVRAAIQNGKKLSVAESCTGGLIASNIVSVAGSSKCFDCGVVSYSNEMKEKVLKVDANILKKCGAVSPQVAEQMAIGVREMSDADIGISTTGIAGPGGGSEEKPVGLVYVGISTKHDTKTYKLLLAQSKQTKRQTIRNLAALFAMNEARKKVIEM
ncbi:MAG: competence/damage-inducible protein A [Oscillospiraceae bacterium]|nr:competence/damage-inducible protein A [Oscillospiraceae bacterium]